MHRVKTFNLNQNYNSPALHPIRLIIQAQSVHPVYILWKRGRRQAKPYLFFLLRNFPYGIWDIDQMVNNLFIFGLFCFFRFLLLPVLVYFCWRSHECLILEMSLRGFTIIAYWKWLGPTTILFNIKVINIIVLWAVENKLYS